RSHPPVLFQDVETSGVTCIVARCWSLDTRCHCEERSDVAISKNSR
ncbi:MAG: hypothetical protein HWN79_19405, partial [Candidatus Lokiarchaeota archaeon]|nr:hypothetical protein [Candidatus Lokiarchaeota archaeon]